MLTPTAQKALHPQFTADNTLHVITPISNPRRFESRYRLYQNFAEYASKQPNVTLHTIEAAFGDRDYVLKNQPNFVGVRGSDELWLKENMINIAATRLPADWKYMAWVDGDIEFSRNDWGLETLHLLQHYSVVQMFSHSLDLGPNQEPLAQHAGFVHTVEKAAMTGVNAFKTATPAAYAGYYGHPGYAWAFTRAAFDGVGGMLDTGVAGAGDHHMALGMYGEASRSLPVAPTHPYATPVLQWQDRALRVIKKNVGYMPGTVIHYFHGKKADRKYLERWSIIKNNNFDPSKDLVKDSQGLYKLANVNTQLRDDLRHYFLARQEDSSEAV